MSDRSDGTLASRVRIRCRTQAPQPVASVGRQQSGERNTKSGGGGAVTADGETDYRQGDVTGQPHAMQD